MNYDQKKDLKSEIKYGDRGEPFKKMIINILKQGKLKDKYIDILTNEENMQIYNRVFTHPTANPNDNYEFYEILGDSTINKSIVWYLSRRFPLLAKPEGVPVIARLKINLQSKKGLFSLTENLNFWEFVSSDLETRNTKMKNILEDVFEAFIGATELIIDTQLRRCAGYDICYNIIEQIMNKKHISLKYEDLYDPKTILKEIFDKYKRDSRIGVVKYEGKRTEDRKLSEVIVYNIIGNNMQELGRGKSGLQADAEQIAAKNAIQYLKQFGIKKDIPEKLEKILNTYS